MRSSARGDAATSICQPSLAPLSRCSPPCYFSSTSHDCRAVSSRLVVRGPAAERRPRPGRAQGPLTCTCNRLYTPACRSVLPRCVMCFSCALRVRACPTTVPLRAEHAATRPASEHSAGDALTTMHDRDTPINPARTATVPASADCCASLSALVAKRPAANRGATGELAGATGMHWSERNEPTDHYCSHVSDCA